MFFFYEGKGGGGEGRGGKTAVTVSSGFWLYVQFWDARPSHGHRHHL